MCILLCAFCYVSDSGQIYHLGTAAGVCLIYFGQQYNMKGILWNINHYFEAMPENNLLLCQWSSNFVYKNQLKDLTRI